MSMCFCNKCGMKVDPEQERFCRNCGSNAAGAEPAVLEKMANLFRGVESVGGRMYLTAKGLYFSSHALNVQAGDSRIGFDEILNVEKCNTLGFLPNGLRVITKQGVTYQFVLWGRDDVIACLNLLLRDYRNRCREEV